MIDRRTRRRRARLTSPLIHVLALLPLALATVACGGGDDATAPPSTVGLGGGVGSSSPRDTSASPTTDSPSSDPVTGQSPLAISSTCVAKINGDLRQQMVPPSAVASVRTDHWLSAGQVAEMMAGASVESGSGIAAPLDGWLNATCTLANGDTVTARTVDSTTAEEIPVTPAAHVVGVGLPDADTPPDPSGGATFTVLVTLGGHLFAPAEQGQAIVTTFDGREVAVTVQAVLEEVEPLFAPRRILVDASFRATCGLPYEGCT